MIQRLTRSRGILLNRRPAFLGRVLRVGDLLAVRVGGPEMASLPPLEMKLAVVHEDADLLVLDKPPGLLVHPTSARDTRTLAHGIAHYFREQKLEARVRPVHRLDRDTSGLLLVAKNAFSHQHLDRQLRSGELQREYLAVVEGRVEPAEGVIDAEIGVSKIDRRLRRVSAGGQWARTTYSVVQRFPDATLVSARLASGRTHQIRVHFAHLGHPLVGDTAYGASREEVIGRYALHSWRLRLRHPRDGSELKLEAEVPADMRDLISTVGK
jgi:23S rRNA pseudouridine1911/1915/1917 synthase